MSSLERLFYGEFGSDFVANHPRWVGVEVYLKQVREAEAMAAALRWEKEKPLRRNTNMLTALRNVAGSIDGVSVDELLALHAFGRGLEGSYKEFQLGTPDWITESLTVLNQEIKAKHRDILSKQLAEAKARRESLRSTEEKRKAVDASIEELEKALNG
jgi:hypothetical protein